MITIHGTPVKPGVVIAVAAVADAVTGLDGMSPALLESGLRSLRKGLEPRDYPEAIVVCDDLALGVATKLPGIRAIGIAAQSECSAPGLEPQVPCVAGLADLLKSVSQNVLIIVDGNKGTVYVDPDPAILVHYQQIEEERLSHSKVFISSEHIPARTQSGEVVYVHGLVENAADIGLALDEGADGLLVHPGGLKYEDSDLYEQVLQSAAGKPVAFAVQRADLELLRAVMRYSVPGQVTLLFPPEDLEERRADAESLLEAVGLEAFLNDLEPPQVSFGALTTMGELGLQEAMAVTGDTDGLELLVDAGCRSVVVRPESVAAAKNAIRLMGAEEQ